MFYEIICDCVLSSADPLFRSDSERFQLDSIYLRIDLSTLFSLSFKTQKGVTGAKLGRRCVYLLSNPYGVRHTDTLMPVSPIRVGGTGRGGGLAKRFLASRGHGTLGDPSIVLIFIKVYNVRFNKVL